MTATACDLLCVCPHTDDAEIALGGTLRLLADRGRRVWICDLTGGELGTNADTATRWQEAQAAGAKLGLAGRVQLALPDGFLDPASREQVLALIHVLRRLRPSWAVSAPAARRHPDHLAIPALLRRAVFLSRLRQLVAAEPPARWWPTAPTGEPAPIWTPVQVGDTCPEDGRPDLLVDITTTWPAKREALACYVSQFRREAGRAATHINDPSFLTGVEATGRRWGRLAGVEFAEALRLDMRPVVDDLPGGRWA